MNNNEHRVLRPFLTARVRILVALAAGLVLYAVLALPPVAAWVGSAPLRLALAWDLVAAVYLAQAIRMMWRHDLAQIRARAEAIDISLTEIVAIAALAGMFSLFAVAFVLSEARGLEAAGRIFRLVVGILTVFLSWVALHVIFAVHYAHIFYDPDDRSKADKVRGGLEFPGQAEPNYWDFVYFSFVIGMTCQVSDVQVTARDLRHLVTAQGIIAFFYNTVVLALAVNIAASMG
jgi:uncharacterized membrane protein